MPTESPDSVSSVTSRPPRVWPDVSHTSIATPPISPDASSWPPRRTPSAGSAHFPFLPSPSRSLSSSASSAVGQRHRLSSPPHLRPSQPAKSFAKASSTSMSPSLPQSSTDKVALPSSEWLLPRWIFAMLTGDVARASP
jgi:hypothetical protein